MTMPAGAMPFLRLRPAVLPPLPRTLFTGPAFRWALCEELGGPEDREWALLTTLAHAEGTRLPAGPVWRAVASALSQEPVSGADLRWIMDTAGAHVV